MSIKDTLLFGLLFLCLMVIGCFYSLKNKKELIARKIYYENQMKGIQQPVSIQMFDNLERYSEEYGIPKYIAYNIAYLETRYQGPLHWEYKHNRVSPVGALGPMQIMPNTAKLVHKKTIPNTKLKNDVEFNVKTSMILLSKLYKKYQNWGLVCGSYNTGRPMINSYAQFCISNKNYKENWSDN